jgi:hypothetical protein
MNTRLAIIAAALVALALPSGAGAAQLLDTTVSAPSAQKRTCHDRLADGAGVVQRRIVLGGVSAIRADLTAASGDWDLGIFDGVTRRTIGGSAQFGSDEIAETFHFSGPVIVQACRRTGSASSARLTVSATELPKPSGELGKLQLVEVETKTAADKARLQELGIDYTEHAGDNHMEAVLYGDQDVQKLRDNGFSFDVKIADLFAHDLKKRSADDLFQRQNTRSALPSGRTGYRRLADFDAEMKKLAEENPTLVKPLVLAPQTLEGRQIQGIEITENVTNVEDGKPVFLQFGAHHAREWPSAEMPMEFAHDLVRSFGKDARITDLVRRARTIIVPVVNRDGFNLSREASVDLRATGASDRITYPFTEGTLVDEVANNTPAHLVAILADGQTGNFAYKRRNCRVKDGETPAPGACADRNNRTRGVDPNRNYGGFWGGPGASSSPTSDTYRGAGPNSEPEMQAVRALISSRQVTTAITNHTYSNLVLRPPALKEAGAPPDEPVYKALGDSMAAQNGYQSQKSYELYDTTGSMEDWSYYATGGLGFTFEIGPYEFHPEYQQVVNEYEGTGTFAGKGNRAAYLVALEHTADAANHAVIEGRAKPGSTLRLTKSFRTKTYKTAKPADFEDRLETAYTVPADGRVRWHVNQSTRPILRGAFTPHVDPAPVKEIADDGPPLAPGTGARTPATTAEVPFAVKADDAREAVKVRIDWADPEDDYDVTVLKKEGTAWIEAGKSISMQNDLREFATGYSPGENFEEVVLPNPGVGEYKLRVTNWGAIDPTWSYKIQFFKAGATPLELKGTEAWELQCEDGRTTKVVVERGQTFDGGQLCGGDAAASTVPVVAAGVAKAVGRLPLRFSVALERRALRTALRRGLLARGNCSAPCVLRVALTVDRQTAKRLGLRSRTVATGRVARSFSGTRRFSVRFTKVAQRRLARTRRVKLSLAASARGDGGAATVRRSMTLTR